MTEQGVAVDEEMDEMTVGVSYEFVYVPVCHDLHFVVYVPEKISEGHACERVALYDGYAGIHCICIVQPTKILDFLPIGNNFIPLSEFKF